MDKFQIQKPDNITKISLSWLFEYQMSVFNTIVYVYGHILAELSEQTDIQIYETRREGFSAFQIET